MQQQTLLFTDEPNGYFEQLDPEQQHLLLTLMASLIAKVCQAQVDRTPEESADE